MSFRLRWIRFALPLPSLALACGGTPATTPHDSGTHESGPTDGGAEGSPKEAGPPFDSGGPTASNVKHLVVIVQENHSFDNYFGRYCTAATGSAPTCTTGPACCEAGPAKDPGSSATPLVQDDKANGAWDPNHTQACELSAIDGGKMDAYVTSSVCGSPKNFAYADAASGKTYWDLAAKYALADDYFQPIAGESSSNDMYLATSAYVFTDNTYEPTAIGASCEFATQKSFTGKTVADLLVGAKTSWGWFGESYAAMLAAEKGGKCPSDPKCPAGPVSIYPCIYDPGDDPFLYFKPYADDPKYIFDYAELATFLAKGTLPDVAYVKGVGYHSEHPGLGVTLSAGQAFVTQTIDAILASAYAGETLVLVTWDESGGYFDHVAPPPESAVDHQPYGPRVPLLAVGPFAKKNHVSHVQMEHSSIVKFIEWNWLGKKTGQLGQRDAVVKNIGDMLDPSKTGAAVPSD